MENLLIVLKTGLDKVEIYTLLEYQKLKWEILENLPILKLSHLIAISWQDLSVGNIARRGEGAGTC